MNNSQYAYPWNAPRPAIGRDRPLTRDELRQVQAVLLRISKLPFDLSSLFTRRYEFIRREKGVVQGFYYLTSNIQRRVWPRIESVNRRNGMNVDVSGRFFSERDTFERLPGMNDRELTKFASRIASQIFLAYEEMADRHVEENGGDPESLFDDAVQDELYGEIARAARAFRVTPLYWRKHCKRCLTVRQAYSGIARLISDDWWKRQLKSLRTRWREALMIAVGEVNADKSPYASKQAVRDVHARRLANMDYLRGCELENKETGERIDLIEKVMRSISNPEIRRMELMNTIAGIERYAASVGDVGMFVTITTPSKYHPTRQVGRGKDKRVQLNNGWNDFAYTPKDGQRYLCRIWSLIRTAFKDKGLQVYGMRVVEPHHDGTPHWHMMLFCQRDQRSDVIDIMRRYAMKEDGGERGAARNRFECKHMNKGGAAGYIAKYIAKNIDGHALDGQLDHDTGKPLSDTAAAVTAWASTWRIPQFKPIGVPTMGAYRELRKLPRGVSIADAFDERVEAVRAAADAGDFDLYIAAQGGANVGRNWQTVRVARRVAEELNAYDEEVQKVVGIFAPHLPDSQICETRLAQWRIVPKAPASPDFDFQGGFAAPRSPVNNCGLPGSGGAPVIDPTPSERAAAVLNLIERGVIDWKEPDVARALRDAVKEQTPATNRQQRAFDPTTDYSRAPSARMTGPERHRIPQIRIDLIQHGITPQRWELEALARGARVRYGDKTFHYPAPDEWPGFST